MHTWEQCREIISTKSLKDLRRSPEQSATYKAAKLDFEKSHGGTAQFVISERLQWTGDALKPKSNEFLGSYDDTKVLLNDFPYNFEPGITHYVVWSKVRIPCGDDEMPTDEAAKKIEEFLKLKFPDVDCQNILWFKNTFILQSIPSVSHFHVLVRSMPKVKQ